MIQAYIEIPRFSHYKYELDPDLKLLIIDRPLNQAIPQAYGFLAGTKAEDGDELDCFILSKYPVQQGTLANVEIQSVIICKDDGIPDHKLLVSIVGEEYSEEAINGVINYLKTYKKEFEVERLGSKEEAIEIFKKSVISV